ncbi:hypothetical protein WCE41_02940 [Luteimonas sp. MJ246]|uniref:hypothetical protein n=1 Tax=Luteimonas sp. MJ174 TaxID=3129237 RepID=UPI0031BAF730
MPERDATRDRDHDGDCPGPGGHAVLMESGADADAPDAAQAGRLCDLLREDDLDAAIDGGLARFQPLPGLDAGCNAMLSAARDRLLVAWAARDRHRARDARLERIANGRLRARGGLSADSPLNQPPSGDAAVEGPAQAGAIVSGISAGIGGTGAGSDTGTLPAPSRSTLPAAAAAALARARARASGTQS